MLLTVQLGGFKIFGDGGECFGGEGAAVQVGGEEDEAGGGGVLEGGFERALVPVYRSSHSLTLVQITLGTTCSSLTGSSQSWLQGTGPCPPQSCAPLMRGP